MGGRLKGFRQLDSSYVYIRVGYTSKPPTIVVHYTPLTLSYKLPPCLLSWRDGWMHFWRVCGSDGAYEWLWIMSDARQRGVAVMAPMSGGDS